MELKAQLGAKRRPDLQKFSGKKPCNIGLRDFSTDLFDIGKIKVMVFHLFAPPRSDEPPASPYPRSRKQRF
jgi:hypothetical protein